VLSVPLLIRDTQPYGQNELSTPPDRTRLVPLRMFRRAWASTSSPPAWSLIMTPAGPRMPCRIEICPELTA
jgi:hypothetical protein